MEIKCYVRNQELVLDPDYNLVAGSKNYLKAKFYFDSKWKNLNKTVVFSTYDKETKYQILMSGNECLVPYEVIKKDGFYISILGGDLLNTNSVLISVKEGDVIPGVVPPEPTKSIYDQMITSFNGKIEEAKKILLDVTEKAETTITNINNHKTAAELDHPNKSIKQRHMGDKQVGTLQIADYAVGTGQIAQGAVNNNRLSNSSVNTRVLADGGVITSKIADESVTTDKIAPSSINSTKISNGAVTNGKIEDGAITSSKIADNSITERKIADNSVTSPKIMGNSINLEHLTEQVREFIVHNAGYNATDMYFGTKEEAVDQGYPECTMGLSYKFGDSDLHTELFITQNTISNSPTKMYYRFRETSITYPWIEIASADEIQLLQKDIENCISYYDCGDLIMPTKYTDDMYVTKPYDIRIEGDLIKGDLIKFYFNRYEGDDEVHFPLSQVTLNYIIAGQLGYDIVINGEFTLGHTYICAVTNGISDSGRDDLTEFTDGEAVAVLDNGQIANSSIIPSHLAETTKALINDKCGEQLYGKTYKVGSTTYTGPVGAERYNDYTTNVSNGKYARAEGSNTIANANYSHAEGYKTKAIGQASHAEGWFSEAGDSYSHAEGCSTHANGQVSHSEGYASQANGPTSHAEGSYSVAAGVYSHAEGCYSTANSFLEHAQGTYNKLSTNYKVYNGTGNAHVIGNGTSASLRSNAFRITFDGKVYAQSDFNSTGADYAEYFEWVDANVENEDRVGYFVALDGDKIRKATSADTDILGIVSANPAVVGNAYEDTHHGMYERDIWGRIEYEYVTVPAQTGIDGTEMLPAREDYVPKINPDYNPDMEYIPRSKRPEWSAVGMFGQLLVHDDGTCVVGGYCTCTDDATATASDIGYRVLSRVSDNIIKVLVK